LLLESLEREPNSSWAHSVMGLVRRFQDRPPEAMVEYETAIALDPNNVVAIRQMGQLLRNLRLRSLTWKKACVWTRET